MHLLLFNDKLLFSRFPCTLYDNITEIENRNVNIRFKVCDYIIVNNMIYTAISLSINWTYDKKWPDMNVQIKHTCK